jgi:hypothetical protein
MATTTPNFGWPVPTSSDLVKNGATAIEGLGDAIDTTMATMIAKTIVDAKGDIIAATAADTVSKLTVGANNTVLTADSSTATGLKWATPAAGGGGKVLQVVNATYATGADSSSTTYADTGLTATITPTLSTSKILVLVHQKWQKTSGNSNQAVGMRLLRGATNILEHTLLGYMESATYMVGMWSIAYYDSPATTSATTYKTQFAANVAAASVAVNGGSNNASITLLEIGA